MWWQDAVIYQVYPRSFQDSDGDGIGDLPGNRAAARPPGVARRGRALAVADLPVADARHGLRRGRLQGRRPGVRHARGLRPPGRVARERGLRVLLDLVPCHTSIEHPWFSEHPDWYIWRDEPNNWLSAFGGSAWSELDGRYYLHSFYPEQPDLDWRNPEVVAAMQDALRFWVERGAAGYRVDAIDRLLKDPRAARRPARDRGVRAAAERGGGEVRAHELAQRAGHAPRRWRRSARRWGTTSLIGEVYLPSARWQPYLESPRRGVRVRAAALRVGRRAAPRGDRGDHAPPRRGVGALEPRLRPARDPLRARERALRGAAPADAARTGVPLPGRRDRARPTGRAASACTTAPGATASATRCSGTARRLAASRPARPGCRRWTRGHERRGAARRPGLDALARARPARRAGACSATGFELLDAAPGVLAYRRGEHTDRRQHDRRGAARAGRRRGRARDACRARSTPARSAPSSAAMTMGIVAPALRG